MILDTSALAAILFGESDAESLAIALAADPVREISALTLLELLMVVESRKGPLAVDELEALLVDLGVKVQPLDETQAKRAFLAWRKFGKGRHPAGLNLGDVCSYALAAERSEPLLFKGDDFARTDCRRVKNT